MRKILAPPFTAICHAIKVCDIQTDSRKRTSNKKPISLFATTKKTKNKSSRQQCQPKKKYIASKKSDLDLLILNHIVMQLERDKANNNGKLAIGAISMIVARMKPTAPFLTKDMIKYHLWKLNKTEKQRGGADYTQTDLLYPSSSTTTASATHLHVDTSTISTLTKDHEDSMEGIREEPSTTVGNNALVLASQQQQAL